MLSPESSAEPGRWRTSRTPYMREPMDEITNPDCESVVVMASSQVGKTELCLNTMGYFVHQDPSPILLVEPTLDIAEAYSKDRLAPMIRDTEVLCALIADVKSRDSGNTILHKALSLDTPIPTPGGWTTMGQLLIGDLVFDENGRSCKVIDATDVMQDRHCYAVQFSDGAKIIADAGHLWPVEEWRVLKLVGKPTQTNVQSLLSTADIARHFFKGDRYRYSIALAKPLDLPSADDLIVHPYVLGVWLGNGLSHRACIAEGNDDADEMANLIGACGHSVSRQAHFGSCAILVIDRQTGIRDALGRMIQSPDGALADLRRLGLLSAVGNESNKHIPHRYLRASYDQRLSLLQGLMDTDGHIRSKDGLCVFSTSLPRLGAGVADLLSGLGIKFHQRTVAAYYTDEGKRTYCKDSIRFEFNVSPAPAIFRLQRKRRIQMDCQPLSLRSTRRRIVSVDPVDSVPVRCIAVDSPSHLYLAGRQMVPTHNSFPGGHITLAGSNSPSGLASRPIRIVIYDECDRYAASAGSEGSPIAIGNKRATTFWNRKKLYASSPTIKDMSNIEALYEASDKRRYHVPCWACGKEQVLDFEHIRWEPGKPETAMYVCQHCGAGWSDAQRYEAIMNGRWIAEAPFKGMAGFHIWEAYNPWVKLADIAKTFLPANERAKQGDKTALQAFFNTTLGQTWAEASEGVSTDPLLDRRENYAADALPWRVLYLTAGIDVQDDRVEAEVVGWRSDRRNDPEESWGVEVNVIYGDPAKPEIWTELDEYLQRSWTTEDGRQLRLGAVGVDSGGHHTDSVYKFCTRRIGRHVYAVKGMAGIRPMWPPKVGKSKKYKGHKVWIVGVDVAKDAIYSRLRIGNVGPGYCHFPLAYTRDYFEQLTSEQVKTRYVKGHPVREWHKPAGKRNEALDRRAYATAVLYSRLIPWEILARSAPTEPPDNPTDPAPPDKPKATTPPPPKPALGGRQVRFRVGGR
jgi:phage terminase large subunit GpA-like protein